MSGFRMDRINSQLMREISRILMSDVKDEVASQAIVTSVECSKDLKYAKVYYTALTARRKSLAEALEKVAGFVRKTLGSRLRYRTVPLLTFVFDETEEKARQMDTLLDQVVTDLPPEPEAEAPDGSNGEGK
ncbi:MULTISPECIES: 30S ribosome-binding factor RbfA [Jonquetella]|uniref:30S ribosome-binding factor RbfA n=1 Tax=Jonquetella TaxID=428711 RepID=UPI0003ADF023|nr:MULTISPECIES: 30S ribosome-binding factor RbfA [Jonquetella]ERL23483.1 ribosome-binding factor A [Jonquetella sp. BV3C21]